MTVAGASKAPDKGTDQATARGNGPVEAPVFRRLRGYAFDPSLSTQLETAVVNEITFKVPWEDIGPGPVGDYVEVVDYDPASRRFYVPIDLNDPHIIAQDGLPPSEGNPLFHQQMVYAVAMTTIKNFEQALGRRATWGTLKVESPTGETPKYEYVSRLRIYPHAFRHANAYYDHKKKALLFGYFPASDDIAGRGLPGGIVFTCLSHDIIAHETTHALLDGMYPGSLDSTGPDGLAFHEAFADIVALFQHFSFPEVLRHQIAKTRGDLASQSLLGQLAQEFGTATGLYGALRDAIGRVNPETKQWEMQKPNPEALKEVVEPHARGAILVAAVFDAFLSIYRSRVADLLRIATNGTGVLPEGQLHPDLVNRLAAEAAKSAKHVLYMCVRAIDYCPPADMTFGDYLRAIITADADLVPDDDKGYRVAFIEAFRRRGIYPLDIRTLSADNLRWDRWGINIADVLGDDTVAELRNYAGKLRYAESREDETDIQDEMQYKLHEYLRFRFEPSKTLLTELRKRTGLALMVDSDLSAVLADAGEDRDKLRQAALAFERSMEDIQKLQKELPKLGMMPIELDTRPIDDRKSRVSRDKSRQPKFEVYAVRPIARVGPDGQLLDQLIISVRQRRIILSDESRNEENVKGSSKSGGGNEPGKTWLFRAGCSFIVDLSTYELRYCIHRSINDVTRFRSSKQYVEEGLRRSLLATYFGTPYLGDSSKEGLNRFALLHSSFTHEEEHDAHKQRPQKQQGRDDEEA